MASYHCVFTKSEEGNEAFSSICWEIHDGSISHLKVQKTLEGKNDR